MRRSVMAGRAAACGRSAGRLLAAGCVALAVMCSGDLRKPMIVGAATAAEGDRSGGRFALVIGNADYRTGALATPVNDARAIAGVLARMGFAVTRMENSRKADLLEAFGKFRHQAAGADTALFYFAGHGAQLHGHNYILPTDLDAMTPQAIAEQGIDLDAVIGDRERTEAGVDIFVLDACRTSPVIEGGASGLAEMQPPDRTVIAYATSPGSVAVDLGGEHGIFTQELLKLIQEPGLRIEEVFQRTRDAVAKRAKDAGVAQMPWEASSLTQPFYLLPPARLPTPLPSATDIMTVAAPPAASGEHDAKAMLKLAYESGNYRRALLLASDLAAHDIPVGQYYLALLYRDGRSIVADDYQAAAWLHRAAASRLVEAEAALGWMIVEHRTPFGDDARAFALFQAAAESDNASAEAGLGLLYRTGTAVPKDYAKARRYYRLAEAQDNARAQNDLGLMYENGWGVNVDARQAKELYSLSAEQGFPLGQLNLGRLYELGVGVAQDPARAASLYRRAAEQGVAEAQGRIGAMYHDGRGVPRDLDAAKRWYARAADQNDPYGETGLGVMYRDGETMTPDFKIAAQWFSKAALQGHAPALSSLAWLYYRGQGVAKSVARAVELMRQAAQSGDAEGEFGLGTLYESGEGGLKRSTAEARQWYEKANLQNHVLAGERLRQLSEPPTKE